MKAQNNKDCYEADPRKLEIYILCDSPLCPDIVAVYHSYCFKKARRKLTVSNRAELTCSYCNVTLEKGYWKLECLGNGIHLGTSPDRQSEEQILDTCRQLRGIQFGLDNADDYWKECFKASLNKDDKVDSILENQVLTFLPKTSQPKPRELLPQAKHELLEAACKYEIADSQPLVNLNCEDLLNHLKRLYYSCVKSQPAEFEQLVRLAKYVKDLLAVLQSKFEMVPELKLPSLLLDKVDFFEYAVADLPGDSYVIGKHVLDHVVSCLKAKTLKPLSPSTVKLIEDMDCSRLKEVDSSYMLNEKSHDIQADKFKADLKVTVHDY